MTSIRSIRSIAILCGAVALGACEKNAVQDITGTLPAARIKFFNYGVSSPSVNFYANTTKMTAITSATGVEAVTGIAQGGVGGGGSYSGIAPGQYTLTARISAAVDKDLAITTVPATIADGKAYSMYISGIYNTTGKTAEGFVIEDPIPLEFSLGSLDFTTASVRFVNAISNAQPMALFVRNPTDGVERPIGGAVSYKGGSAFVSIPAGVYELNTRVSGSTTNAISRSGVSFVGGRIYTVGARGNITIISTTDANRPQLDNAANR